MKSKARVMAICDNMVLAESLKIKIIAAGFEPVHAKSSNAVQNIFEEVPHLLLIDEDFDNGRGKLIASLIKEDLILKNIPIVLMISEKMLFYRKKDIVADVYFEKNTDQNIAEVMQKVIRESQNELDVNPLTHLPGIRSSISSIEKRVDSKESFAVCYVDLTDMAAFNSVYGDARGDDVIIKVSNIIKDCIRQIASPDAFVGHLGGDDFIFVTSVSDATKVSEVITRRFDEIAGVLYDPKDRDRGYIIQRNHEGMLTQYPIMSVLISIIYCEAISASRIFGLGRVAADLKQYMKMQAASCYIEFNYGDGQKVVDVYQEEKLDVRFPGKSESVTISKQEFVHGQSKYEEFFDKILDKKLIYSVYQPIVDFRTKKVLGYEALTRSFEEKFKNPEHLFNLARESGKIKELDKICVDCALKSAQSIDPEKKLFLNINHETLMDAHFMRHFFDEKGCIGFKNIVIEITEQSLLRSFEKIKKALLELKEQGVFVAIDDVGGGAVSLRDVAVLKPEYIKFDRSLVRQIDINVTKQQIVISMLLFSSGIQAIVMAEGIETPNELETLLACGVYLGQGYLFVKPGLPFPKVENI